MTVRQGLLAVLTSGPQHGYQIKTNFESTTGGIWKLNVGQVYTTLDRLERDGMVEVDTANETKIYSLTTSGENELARWWQPGEVNETPPRDELMLKVFSALAQGPEHALKVVTSHRAALTSLLQYRRSQMRSEDSSTNLAHRLLNDALLLRAESDLRWLDTCESRILAVHEDNKRKPK